MKIVSVINAGIGAMKEKVRRRINMKIVLMNDGGIGAMKEKVRRRYYLDDILYAIYSLK
jgi:hypothetical protein